MLIVHCSSRLMDQAEGLVCRVFPLMTLMERLSFVAIRRPESLTGRALMALAGVKDIIAFDVCVDNSGVVLGTTGLYRYNRDADEAVWIAWFCVDPAVRGCGIGQALLDHTVSVAQVAGFSRVRLYTSTDPREADAQRLYEKNGFRETGRKEKASETIVFREKVLGGTKA